MHDATTASGDGPGRHAEVGRGRAFAAPAVQELPSGPDVPDVVDARRRPRDVPRRDGGPARGGRSPAAATLEPGSAALALGAVVVVESFVATGLTATAELVASVVLVAHALVALVRLEAREDEDLEGGEVEAVPLGRPRQLRAAGWAAVAVAVAFRGPLAWPLGVVGLAVAVATSLALAPAGARSAPTRWATPRRPGARASGPSRRRGAGAGRRRRPTSPP